MVYKTIALPLSYTSKGVQARTAILLGVFNPCQWLREAVAHQASQGDALLAKKLNQSV
jgi:hypothetical protein